jgi:hypothetical protein
MGMFCPGRTKVSEPLAERLGRISLTDFLLLPKTSPSIPIIPIILEPSIMSPASLQGVHRLARGRNVRPSSTRPEEMPANTFAWVLPRPPGHLGGAPLLNKARQENS